MIDGLIKKIKSVLLRDSNTFTPCVEYVLQPSGEFISHQRATMSHILAAKRKHEDPDMLMVEVIAECTRVDGLKPTAEQVMNFEIALYHKAAKTVMGDGY